MTSPDIPRLGAAQITNAIELGSVVVDVRPTPEFTAGHLPGSIHIPAGGTFAQRLALVVSADAPVVLLVGADSSGLALVASALAQLGTHTVIGWGGTDVLAEWSALGRELVVTSVMEASDVAGDGRLVVDVREQAEWDAGRIPGARHAPLGELLSRLADIPKDQPLVLHCQAGTRGAIAASVLQANGYTNVANLDGGLNGWCEAGLPVSSD